MIFTLSKNTIKEKRCRRYSPFCLLPCFYDRGVAGLRFPLANCLVIVVSTKSLKLFRKLGLSVLLSCVAEHTVDENEKLQLKPLKSFWGIYYLGPWGIHLSQVWPGNAIAVLFINDSWDTIFTILTFLLARGKYICDLVSIVITSRSLRIHISK